MEQSEAFLLRSVDYRDRDRILTLLTPEHGKVSLIARGARGSRRRFAGGALQAFSVLRIGFGWGRGDLGHLQEAHVLHAYPRVLADLRRMTWAGAGLALVREVAPARQGDPPLFEAVRRLLETLDRDASADEALLTCFQLRVMALAGYAPRLDACGRSGRCPEPGRAAYFDPRAGAIVASSEGGGPLVLSGVTRTVMLRALGSDWIEASRAWSPRQRREARAAVLAFIEHRLERPLRNSELVAALRADV